MSELSPQSEAAEELHLSFKRIGETPGAPIARDAVLAAMANPDLDVRGVVETYLSRPSMFARISPPLDADRYHDFLLTYYSDCIVADPEHGDWAESRYSAAYALRSWFVRVVDESDGRSRLLTKIERALRSMYLEGANDVRQAVALGFLGHLFQRKKMRRYFANWKEDRVLAAAHAEALGSGAPLDGKRNRKVIKRHS